MRGRSRPSESASHRWSHPFSSSKGSSINSWGLAYCFAVCGVPATCGARKGQVTIFPLPGSHGRMNPNSRVLSMDLTPFARGFSLHFPAAVSYTLSSPYKPHLHLLHRGFGTHGCAAQYLKGIGAQMRGWASRREKSCQKLSRTKKNLWNTENRNLLLVSSALQPN